jgi:hypothetical protein
LLVIAAMHAGTGVVVSVLPDDALESGPEPYEQYLKVRPRMLSDKNAPPGIGCTRPGGLDGSREAIGGAPRRRALVPEAGYEISPGTEAANVDKNPAGLELEAVPPL